MSWLLFMDESGHDHQTVPYEVRGGVALHSSKLWPFVHSMKGLEENTFGVSLSRYNKEIKGSKLLKKSHFRWATQQSKLDEGARRKHSMLFLNKSSRGIKPSRVEYTAYGQSCIEMVHVVLQLLLRCEATLFAAAIPRGVQQPAGYEAKEYLRKDHVFLFERFFYFLEGKKDHGLLVMDESEKNQDRKFVRRLERYFKATLTGQHRTTWIVPTPLFVSSDMVYPIQAADLCIYCINWGFRIPSIGMDAEIRPEIAREFGYWLDQLQYKGEGYREGKTFFTHGIVFVPDPFESRA